MSPNPSTCTLGRHAARVMFVKNAARYAAAELLAAAYDPGWGYLDRPHAAALIALRAYGRWGVEPVPARLPCFRSLGSGRSDGVDGRTWDAAYTAAFHELVDEFCGGWDAAARFEPAHDGRLRFVICNDVGAPPVWEGLLPADEGLTPWYLAVARMGHSDAAGPLVGRSERLLASLSRKTSAEWAMLVCRFGGLI